MKKINLPNGIDLEFDHRRHKYYRDGREVQGVTKISAMMGDAGWRIPWAAKLAKERAAEVFLGSFKEGFISGNKWHTDITECNYESVAETIGQAHKDVSGLAIGFGNAAHRWLENYINWKIGRGKEPTKLKDQGVRDAVRPFCDWSEKYEPDYIASEEVVYYEGHIQGFYFDYAGTLDIRFNLNGRHCIGDFKTGKHLSTEFVWQMALYSAACEQSYPGKQVDHMFIFKLPKEGFPWALRVIQVDDVYREIAPYLAAAKLKDQEAKQQLKVKHPSEQKKTKPLKSNPLPTDEEMAQKNEQLLRERHRTDLPPTK